MENGSTAVPIINDNTFADRYRMMDTQPIYPSEWVIRTLLGSYPRLKLDKNRYNAAKILDIGFGDGRNFPLLNNCGFDIHGIETEPGIIDTVSEKMVAMGIPVTLSVGSNAVLPYEDNTFDFILASFSWYYIGAGTRFEDNIREYSRVLKPGGQVIATLASEETFIFKGGIDKGDGHLEITNDIFGMRNGDILKCFYTEDELEQTMRPWFDEISIGRSLNDYYGLSIGYFMFVGRNKDQLGS